VQFGKRMDADSKQNTARFWENVRVLSLPTENPYEPVNLDTILLTDLPEGATYLRCDKLKVLNETVDGKGNQQMEAHGRVYVQGKDFYARAHSVYYNQRKDQIILEASPGGQAALYKVPANGVPSTVTGQKIIYNRATGRVDVQAPNVLEGTGNPAQ
jgi:hypothetical protein